MYLSRVSLDLHKRATMIAFGKSPAVSRSGGTGVPRRAPPPAVAPGPAGGKTLFDDPQRGCARFVRHRGSIRVGRAGGNQILRSPVGTDPARQRLALPVDSQSHRQQRFLFRHFRARQGAGPCHAGISRRLASGARRKAWILPEKPASDRVPVAAVPKRAAGKACHTALCRV